MEAKITEKNLEQIVNAVVMGVLDPSKKFKSKDCQTASAIATEVVKELKELGFVQSKI